MEIVSHLGSDLSLVHLICGGHGAWNSDLLYFVEAMSPESQVYLLFLLLVDFEEVVAIIDMITPARSIVLVL